MLFKNHAFSYVLNTIDFVKRPVTQISLHSAFAGNTSVIFTREIWPFKKHPNIKFVFLIIEIRVQYSYLVENRF